MSPLKKIRTQLNLIFLSISEALAKDLKAQETKQTLQFATETPSTTIKSMAGSNSETQTQIQIQGLDGCQPLGRVRWQEL